VTSPVSANLNASQILEALGASGATPALNASIKTPDQLEAAFMVDFKEVKRLEHFQQRLRELSPEVKISCLDDRAWLPDH